MSNRRTAVFESHFQTWRFESHFQTSRACCLALTDTDTNTALHPIVITFGKCQNALRFQGLKMGLYSTV